MANVQVFGQNFSIVHYDHDLCAFDPKVTTCMKDDHGNNLPSFNETHEGCKKLWPWHVQVFGWSFSIVHYDLDLWPFDPRVPICMKNIYWNNSGSFIEMKECCKRLNSGQCWSFTMDRRADRQTDINWPLILCPPMLIHV